jgi:hypothetical protein
VTKLVDQENGQVGDDPRAHDQKVTSTVDQQDESNRRHGPVNQDGDAASGPRHEKHPAEPEPRKLHGQNRIAKVRAHDDAILPA